MSTEECAKIVNSLSETIKVANEIQEPFAAYLAAEIGKLIELTHRQYLGKVDNIKEVNT